MVLLLLGRKRKDPIAKSFECQKREPDSKTAQKYVRVKFEFLLPETCSM